MIRTIRKVLVGVLSSRDNLTDSVLMSAHCEVENIVKSRPLSKCSDDIDDSRPLTPITFYVEG